MATTRGAGMTQRVRKVIEEIEKDPGYLRPTAKAAIVRMSEVASEEIDWLWERWIPSRMLTILGGYGGDGKSTVMASLIGAWTTGGPLPDGTTATPTNVLMLSAEDDAAYAIRPRLDLHGADPKRVIVLKGRLWSDGRARWTDLKRDVEVMRTVIEQHRIGVVVIDPLSSYLPKADRNNEGDIRDALQPLLGLMEATGSASWGSCTLGRRVTAGGRASGCWGRRRSRRWRGAS